MLGLNNILPVKGLPVTVRLFVVSLAALVAVAGCAPDLPRNANGGKIALLAAQSPDSGTRYRLGVGDRVKITVLGQPDLSTESEVDAGGKIVVALAGAVDAAGHTVGEVEEEIRNRYAGSILRDPKVAIQVIEYRPVTVTGEVKSPGRYKFTFGMDVRAATAMAGGVERRGSKEVAVVYRDGQPYEAKPDSQLQPGDTLEVPRR
jgi:protein involved in polysaccharide export with SLBB domain